METVVGIIKEIDKPGRIVIPKDIRERYGFDDNVEIVTLKEGILIKSRDYVLIKKNNEVK